jgi:hypothetical protein
LISRPASINNPIEEKLCDNEINNPLNNPQLPNDKQEQNAKFKCKIEEKAIIFFKSKYL